MSGPKLFAAPELFGLFSRLTPLHSDNDRARQYGVGEPSDSGQRHGAIGRDFLGENLFTAHDTAASNGAAPMSGIEQAANFLIVLCLRPKHGVDFVKQNRAAALLAHLSEKICWADVHRLHWRRH